MSEDDIHSGDQRIDDLSPETDPDPVEDQNSFADPRLLERALKRMKGLLKGNGVDDLSVVTLGEQMEVRPYRFAARVQIKLVPQYGVRLETGKNMTAELAVSQEDFQKKIQNSIYDARTIPEKRQMIVDFIYSRTDKGFGIKDQAVTFRQLTRDLVQHEQCQPCSHSGKVACPRCHGKGVSVCPSCRGVRQMPCTRCAGSGRRQTPQGLQPCDLCRSSGKVPCTFCGAQGQVKCRGCAASGDIACQKCAGTGWLSHLAHIKLEGQIHFDFDRINLPDRLVALVEDRGSFLVSKGDLEATLRPQPLQAPVNEGIGSQLVSSGKEADDQILLEYDVTCPYGSIEFDVAGRKIPALLLGWQARLIEAPAFLEDYTKTGMEALKAAASCRGDVVDLLKRASRFAIWQDVISQVVASGNLRKISLVILNRYTAGVSKEIIREMLIYTDRAVRGVTRQARYVGMAGGLSLYAGLSIWYFLYGGRDLVPQTIPELVPDLSLPICGLLMGTLAGQVTAFFRQRQVFQDIVRTENLKIRLPRAGRIIWWSLLGSILIPAAILLFSVLNEVGNIPDWLTRLMPV
ncbi:MAG: hypothetical protein AUJ12_09075 [Alphaproteobacteria bacterium CG1_02_46_17]|nr:MAG: hypothetical protein AUJ12_09075 [Alphaproteobacteria bacterium CG1_02_46_17]